MKLGKFREGQMAVVMTLVIATLVGVMSLCADVGIMYYNWVQLQKGADAAAMAGASYLNEGAAGVTLAAADVNADGSGYDRAHRRDHRADRRADAEVDVGHRRHVVEHERQGGRVAELVLRRFLDLAGPDLHRHPAVIEGGLNRHLSTKFTPPCALARTRS